jgi:hypothetical protein
MVQLSFNAADYPLDKPEPDDTSAPATTWDPTPTTQKEYIAACKARLQVIDAANKRWRKAIRVLQAAKIEADELRDAWHELKATKPPRSPYADILLGGGQIDPDLANE